MSPFRGFERRGIDREATLRAPLRCWSCGAENDLDVAQTCARCGAPLVKSRALFSKPVLLGIVVGFLLLQAFCLLTRYPR